MAEKKLQVTVHVGRLLSPVASATCDRAHCTGGAHVALVVLPLFGSGPRLCVLAPTFVLAEPLPETQILAEAIIDSPADESAAAATRMILRLICDELESLPHPNTAQLKELGDLVVKSYNAHVTMEARS